MVPNSSLHFTASCSCARLEARACYPIASSSLPLFVRSCRHRGTVAFLTFGFALAIHSLGVERCPFPCDRHMVPDVTDIFDQGQVFHLIARGNLKPNVAWRCQTFKQKKQ